MFATQFIKVVAIQMTWQFNKEFGVCFGIPLISNDDINDVDDPLKSIILVPQDAGDVKFNAHQLVCRLKVKELSDCQSWEVIGSEHAVFYDNESYEWVLHELCETSKRAKISRNCTS